MYQQQHLSRSQKLFNACDNCWGIIPYIGNRKKRHRRDYIFFIIILALLGPISFTTPTDSSRESGFAQVLYQGKGLISIGSFSACFADPSGLALDFAKQFALAKVDQAKEVGQGVANQGINAVNTVTNAIPGGSNIPQIKSPFGKRAEKRELGNGPCTGLSPFGWKIPDNIVQNASRVGIDLGKYSLAIRTASVGFALFFWALLFVGLAGVIRVVSAHVPVISRWRPGLTLTSWILTVLAFFFMVIPIIICTVTFEKTPPSITASYRGVFFATLFSIPFLWVLIVMLGLAFVRARKERKTVLYELGQSTTVEVHNGPYTTPEQKEYVHDDYAHKEDYTHHDSHRDDHHRPRHRDSYDHSRASHRDH